MAPDSPDAKKARVDTDEGEDINEDEWVNDPAVKATLEAAKEAQAALNKINDAASEEVLLVEQRYNIQRQPAYKQRGDALQQVPGFWRHALLGHPNLAEFFTSDDLSALEALKRLDVVDAPDIKSGFTVTFTFDPEANKYFSNEVLEKTLRFEDDASLEAQASAIQWREEMDPTANDDTLPEAGSKRPRRPDYNFFTSWFLSERYAPGTQDAVAEFIKDEVWPDPIKYWRAGLVNEQTAILLEDEEFEGEEGEDDEEGEEYDEGEDAAVAGDQYAAGGFEDLAEDEGEEADDQGS